MIIVATVQRGVITTAVRRMVTILTCRVITIAVDGPMIVAAVDGTAVVVDPACGTTGQCPRWYPILSCRLKNPLWDDVGPTKIRRHQLTGGYVAQEVIQNASLH